MAARIDDDFMSAKHDGRVIATARCSSHAAADGHGVWIVSDRPGRLFTRNEAITAMVLAEIRITTALAVVAVAVVAAVISYQHAYELVRSHGESGVTARLLPFIRTGRSTRAGDAGPAPRYQLVPPLVQKHRWNCRLRQPWSRPSARATTQATASEPSPANSTSTAARSNASSTKRHDSADRPGAQSRHVTAHRISSAPYPPGRPRDRQGSSLRPSRLGVLCRNAVGVTSVPCRAP